MRYINLRFTYLLTYLRPKCTRTHLVSAETLRRNTETVKIGANCNTGSLAVSLLAVEGQSGAYASWQLTRKLTALAYLPSFFLVSQPASPCPLSSRTPCVDDYGWSGSTASEHMLRLLLLSLSVGRQSVSVSATVTAVSESSVSAVVSLTAITGLQLQRHFRLRPKREKLFFWSLS